jgi:hypothetical protein
LKWCDSGVWRCPADGSLLPTFELCFTTGSGQLVPLAESDIDALHRHDLPHNRGGLVTHHSSKYDVEGKLCLATQSDRPWTRICVHSAGTAFRPHRQKSLSKESIVCWRLKVLTIFVSKCNPQACRSQCNGHAITSRSCSLGRRGWTMARCKGCNETKEDVTTLDSGKQNRRASI